MTKKTETPGECDPAAGNSCNCMNLCITCHCNGGPDQAQMESILSDSSNNTAESVLLLRACILDMQIETPDQTIVVDGDEEVLLSEILNKIA